MNDDDGVLVLCGDRLHESISVVPSSQVLPVTLVAVNSNVCFSRVCVNEDKSSILANRDISSSFQVVVIEEPRDASVISPGTLLNGLIWCDEVGKVGSSAPAL